jgi:ribonuclease HI
VYEALLHDLRVAVKLGIKWLRVRGVSQLVVNQVRKEASCRDPRMATYCLEVRKLADKFEELDIHHVLRKDNEATDAWLESPRPGPRLDGGICHRPASTVYPAR